MDHLLARLLPRRAYLGVHHTGGCPHQKLVARSRDLLNTVIELDKARVKGALSYFDVSNLTARVANLIHSAAGPKSAYAEQVRHALKEKTVAAQFLAIAGALQAFHLDLADGHLINIRHEVEAVVVSEILAQAKKLRRTKGVHPAAAIIVAGAAAEEFLRNWCEERGVAPPEKQRSLSAFAAALRKDGAIPLPIERRIQSWADYRNDAAHGDKWEAITPTIADQLVKEVEDFIIENRSILGS